MATLVKAEPKMGDSFCLFDGVEGGRHGDESSASAAPVDTEDTDLNFQNMVFFSLAENC